MENDIKERLDETVVTVRTLIQVLRIAETIGLISQKELHDTLNEIRESIDAAEKPQRGEIDEATMS